MSVYFGVVAANYLR